MERAIAVCVYCGSTVVATQAQHSRSEYCQEVERHQNCLCTSCAHGHFGLTTRLKGPTRRMPPGTHHSTVCCADKTMDVGPTVVRFIKHMKALKASDPFCTPATLYPGVRIPTQCAVRKKRTPHCTSFSDRSTLQCRLIFSLERVSSQACSDAGLTLDTLLLQGPVFELVFSGGTCTQDPDTGKHFCST